MTIIVNYVYCVLHSRLNYEELHFTFEVFDHTTLYTLLPGLVSKEVIRPQVPLRPPCYDFSLVADPRFDSTN